MEFYQARFPGAEGFGGGSDAWSGRLILPQPALFHSPQNSAAQMPTRLVRQYSEGKGKRALLLILSPIPVSSLLKLFWRMCIFTYRKVTRFSLQGRRECYVL